MTPAARIATAIEILDAILAGAHAEQALTSWARRNRFAGSGDRAAIRDHVYDALRCRRSFAAMGGAEAGAAGTGRQLMIGALRAADEDPAAAFTGQNYAPAALSEAERAALPDLPSHDDLPELVALDCPDWLEAPLRAALGGDFAEVMSAMRSRAPVFLRVNLALTDLAAAQAALEAEGILTEPHPLASTALEVVGNPQRIRNSAAYRDGLVELQDAASQAVVEMLPLAAGQRVLDYCAGGGGKTLAMAGRCKARYYVHDVAPQRMRDLPARAERAGVKTTILRTTEVAQAAPFDLILIDVPCSGSGTWRRAPEAKWTFTPRRLEELVRTQREILDTVKDHVTVGGHLAYTTCSLLEEENGAQIRAFLAHDTGWECVNERRLTPLDGGDGFYMALLKRR
ncbi:RsmB/NOP family class I SAM-dependent RNA methyltransferase [Ostreiculturibacter nitratireducens]|uniref:RsmB/NOP family class I SAM-dependent RNA methyltransferase n=1 Tax=Ostreiculturibacter nitratireducens TaxID=3075226 RepID=UPI0031B5668B